MNNAFAAWLIRLGRVSIDFDSPEYILYDNIPYLKKCYDAGFSIPKAIESLYETIEKGEGVDPFKGGN